MRAAALRCLIRPMGVEDIPQVMEVERESFPTMWPPTAFKRELEENRLARYLVAVERRETGAAPPQREAAAPLARLLEGLRHVFAGEGEPLPPPEERPELVLGFVGIWLLADEAHIVTIAVREGSRGRGIGELLLIAALELARRHGQPLVTLECRVSNAVAISLYRKYGFRQVGIRPRYYSDNREDACIMTLADVTSPGYGERLRALRAEHRRRWGEFELHL